QAKLRIRLETQAKMGCKGDRVGVAPTGGPVELYRQVGFDKIGLDEMALVFELPTLVDQGNKAYLRGIYVEGCPQAYGHAVIYTPHQARINGEVHGTRIVGNIRNHFQIEGHAAFAFEGDPDRKADCEAIKNTCGLAASVSNPWDHNADVTAHRYSVLSGSRGYTGY